MTKFETIKKIQDGGGVTGIGIKAFYGCTNLKSVTIPDSVKNIENGAFEGCYDTPVKCPKNGGVYRHLMWGENGKDCGETQSWAVYPY